MRDAPRTKRREMREKTPACLTASLMKRDMFGLFPTRIRVPISNVSIIAESGRF